MRLPPQRRPRPADDGRWRAEDSDDWIARGVRPGSIPFLDEVLEVAHARQWPATVRRYDEWTCVVVPCFTDLANAMEQHLIANGAVAPGASASAGGGADRTDPVTVVEDSPAPEEQHPSPRGLEDDESFEQESSWASGELAHTDANGVTWLSGPPDAEQDAGGAPG